jgi:hypothetical protein
MQLQQVGAQLRRCAVCAVIQIAAQHVHGIDCTQQCRGIEILGSQFVPFVVGDAGCHQESSD